jgi:hypothetical protein
LFAVAACARGSVNAGDDGDGGVPDAPDAMECAKQTYYRDVDGDGHGNIASPMMACEPPQGYVAIKDDCDDADARRFPGAPELCDLVDNDCNPATNEICPTGCTAFRRPPPDDLAHSYLFCTTTATWTNASAVCAGASYKLVQIESAAENTFVRNTATARVGTAVIHIGGNDGVTEGLWVWDSTATQFWQGAEAASGGAPFMGRYQSWDPDEPNNSGGAEDCSEMKSDGTWNDMACGTAHAFMCRR